MDERAAQAWDFAAASGWGGAQLTPLAGDASARRYFRLVHGTASAVLMDAPPAAAGSSDRFTRMARWLVANGLSAPRILAEDVPRGLLLLEDLGDGLVATLCRRTPSRAAGLYSAAVDVLCHLRRCPPPDFLQPLDPAAMAGLLSWVDQWYRPAMGVDADDSGIGAMFAALAPQLGEGRTVALRDYHAENLIWLPDRPAPANVGLLDFQDALLAHPVYDLVSLLQDVRYDVPEALEAAMKALFATDAGLADGFEHAYALIGAHRQLRILAVFARLCLCSGKTRYLDFMPRAWRLLWRNLSHPDLAGLAATVRASLPEPTAGRLARLHERAGTCPCP